MAENDYQLYSYLIMNMSNSNLVTFVTDNIVTYLKRKLHTIIVCTTSFVYITSVSLSGETFILTRKLFFWKCNVIIL